VTEGRGSAFSVRDVNIDDPRPGEVRAVLARAVAGDGDLPFPVPGVLGHEGVGHVEAVGDGVASVAVGEPVLLGWPWCGQCRNCLAGIRATACSWDRCWSVAVGRTAVRRCLDWTARRCTATSSGSRRSPGHAIVAERAVVPVRTATPLGAVGVLACGIATGAGAVLNAVRLEPGSSVMVFGAGGGRLGGGHGGAAACRPADLSEFSRSSVRWCTAVMAPVSVCTRAFRTIRRRC
jgi:aryl-alcohol dehydrogenase